MAFQVSPGVNTSEIDLTNVVVAAGTSVGGAVGRFRWGPIEDVTLVTDEDNLVELFQKPNDDNFSDFFTAANFLAYSGACQVVRAANTTVSNAAAPKNSAAITSGTYGNIQITDSDAYFNNYDDEYGGATVYGSTAPLIAKWAGVLGNSLKMSICPADVPASDGNLTGTVAWTASSGALAGSGTNFQGQLKVGDFIDIQTATGGFVVISIASATAAVVRAKSHSADIAGGKTLSRQKRSVFAQQAKQMIGTVTTTNGSKTVTGGATLGDSATYFDTQLNVGDLITCGGETQRVAAIASATSLTTEKKWDSPNAAVAFERKWEYWNSFDFAPTTSDTAEDAGLECDEIHVAVVDEDGEWTGTVGEVLEKHPNLSVMKGAKSPDGREVYYKNALNGFSNYVWWTKHPVINSVDTAGSSNQITSNTKTWMAWGIDKTTATGLTNTGGSGSEFWSGGRPLTASFIGGTDGSALADADVIRAYDKMKSAEDVDVSLITTSAHSAIAIRHAIDQVAEARKDCMVFFSPEKADVVGVTSSSTATENVTDFRDTVNVNSSYAVMDSGYKYMYDKHNDKYRFVPLNGDIAGLCARTDQVRDPFFSPGGFTRGQILNIIKLPYNPKKAERDSLYSNGVNPVVNFPGEGFVLFGDKTQLTKPSAFDRINVRRLFILLEKAIANAARFQLFEFNDEFTRSQFVSIVEPFLRDIQGRGGIQDFNVVCDASNNTPQVVDSNSFRGDIFVKPSRSINFIQLNFVAVRSGVEFSEVAGAV
jgi:hypothetical protein